MWISIIWCPKNFVMILQIEINKYICAIILLNVQCWFVWICTRHVGRLSCSLRYEWDASYLIPEMPVLSITARTISNPPNMQSYWHSHSCFICLCPHLPLFYFVTSFTNLNKNLNWFSVCRVSVWQFAITGNRSIANSLESWLTPYWDI